MKVIVTAAFGVLLAASGFSSTASANEARFMVQPAVFSSAKGMEALHRKIRRMAREMCKVPGASRRSVMECISETENLAMMESNKPALIAHYQECNQARASRARSLLARASHAHVEQVHAIHALQINE